MRNAVAKENIYSFTKKNTDLLACKDGKDD
jgi:hypothetical protein